MVTSLFWHSAIVELSQFLTQASSSRGRGIWFPESRGQLCRWSKEYLVEFLCLLRSVCWGLRWLDVCMSEVGRVSERTRFKRSSRSIRARSRALRSIVPEAGLECSSSDEDVMSLAQRETRGLPGSIGTTSGSLGMETDGVWWVYSRGKHYSSRCTFDLVCLSICGEYYPPGRLLILSDTLVLVLALCNGRSNKFTLLSVMRRIFASGFRIVPSRGVACSTVIMTRASLFFMSLHSA